MIQADVPGRLAECEFKLLAPLPSSARLKNASSVNEGARAMMGTLLSGIGAARTATCVRNETPSRRDGMINIWRALSRLRGTGVD